MGGETLSSRYDAPASRAWERRHHLGTGSADWPHALAIFCALLALYLYTAPRTVVLEDDGLFILSSWFLGVEHPPGYPVYVLLGKLATLLPFGSPAWRVHALSALCAALACVFVYRIARQLLPGKQAPAWFAALGLGVSATFWSQALIADVYSLHALIFFALLDLALRQSRAGPGDPHGGRRALLSALLLGLGLANHWPLLLLSGPALVPLWLRSWRVLLSWSPLLLLALGVGLAPYGWMVWHSWQLPIISFQGPLADWDTFSDFLLRRGYREIDSSLSAGVGDRLRYLLDLPRLAVHQLGLPGALLAVHGALAQWRHWGARVAGALTLAFLGPTLLLSAMLHFDYQSFQREAFEVYPVVAWGIWALWAGLGLTLLLDGLGRRGFVRQGPERPVAVGLVLVLLLAVGLGHWSANDRHGDRLAHAYATAMLDQLTPGARLLLDGDMAIPASAYLHLILGQRPDVQLRTASALVLEPRLFDPAHTPRPAQREIVAAWIAAGPTPVYRLHNEDGRSGTMSWLLFRIDPDGQGPFTFRLAPAERDFLLWLAHTGPMGDGWDEMLRRQLLTRFVSFQTRAWVSGQWRGDDPPVEAALAAALRLPEAALTRADVLFIADPVAHGAEIDGLLARFAGAADDPALSKRDLALFYWLMARLAHRRGQLATLREAVAQSLHYWPGPENPAFDLAEQLRRLDHGP